MSKKTQAILIAMVTTTLYAGFSTTVKAEDISYSSQIKSGGGKIVYRLTDGDMYYPEDSDKYTTYYYFDTDLIYNSAMAIDASIKLTSYPYGVRAETNIEEVCKDIETGVTADNIDDCISFDTNKAGLYEPQKLQAYIPSDNGSDEKIHAFYIDNEEFTGVYLETMRLYGLIKNSTQELQGARDEIVELIKTNTGISYTDENQLPQIMIRSFFLGINGAKFNYTENGVTTTYQITTADKDVKISNSGWTSSADGGAVSGTFEVTAVPTDQATLLMGTNSGTLTSRYTPYQEISAKYLPVDSFGTFTQKRQLESSFTDYSDVNFIQTLSSDDFKLINEGRNEIGDRQRVIEYNEGQYKEILLWIAKLRGVDVSYGNISGGYNLTYVKFEDIIEDCISAIGTSNNAVIEYAPTQGQKTVDGTDGLDPVAVTISRINGTDTFNITVTINAEIINN